MRPDPVTDGARLHLNEEIESFFGQLLAVPSSSKASRVRDDEGLIAWVRRDLVKERKFTHEDCFPVRRSNRVDTKPTRISFSRDILVGGGQHQRESYTEVLRRRRMGNEGGRWVWQHDGHQPHMQPPRLVRNEQFPTCPEQPPPNQGAHPPQGPILGRQQAP